MNASRAQLPGGSGATPTPRAPDRRDVGAALALGLATAALHALTQQAAYYGDGPQFVNMFSGSVASGELAPWMHALYLPTAWALEALLPGAHPLTALRAVSVLGAALAVACALLLARGLGVSRRGALLGASMLAVTPALWFFGTTIEVHALHAAAVGLCALVTLRAPWSHPARATALSCAVFPLMYLTHKSALLLGPGWVLFVQLARLRATGTRFSTPALLLGVGGAHLVALLAAMAAAAAITGGEGLGVDDTLGFIEQLYRGFRLELLTQGVLLPYAFALPLALFGATRAATSSLERGVHAALLLPILAFFLLLFGDPTEGGYFLGLAPFLAVLLGRGSDALLARRGPALALTLVLAQATVGAWRLHAPSERHLGPERLERAHCARELLPDGGSVLTADVWFQTINGMHADIRELNIVRLLREAQGRLTPAQMAASVLEQLATIPRPVVVDLGHEAYTPRPPVIDYTVAVFAEVEARLPSHRVSCDGRAFLVVDD